MLTWISWITISLPSFERSDRNDHSSAEESLEKCGGIVELLGRYRLHRCKTVCNDDVLFYVIFL